MIDCACGFSFIVINVSLKSPLVEAEAVAPVLTVDPRAKKKRIVSSGRKGLSGNPRNLRNGNQNSNNPSLSQNIPAVNNSNSFMKKALILIFLALCLFFAFQYNGKKEKGIPADLNSKPYTISQVATASVEPMVNDVKDIEKPRENYPDFNWDTLPLYLHVRKADAYTDEEFKFMANFPLITLEKSTGHNTYGTTDQGSLKAAEGIKAVNPNARILYYRNVIVHYGGNTFDVELENIPEPFLRDKRNGKGKLVRGTVEAYDLSIETLREWWIKTAISITNSEHIDGLFLDGNIKVLVPYAERQIGKEKKAATIVGYHEMMTQLRKEMQPKDLMFSNIIRARLPKAGLECMDYFDGSYLENFELPVGMSKADYLVKGIDAVQQAAKKGKIIAMTLGLGESSADDSGIDDARVKLEDLEGVQDKLDYYIALFLVCAERYSYLNIHDGYNVGSIGRKGRPNYKACESKVWLKRFPEYDKPLGKPKGPATKEGYVYTREFEHVSVSVNVETGVGKVDWH